MPTAALFFTAICAVTCPPARADDVEHLPDTQPLTAEGDLSFEVLHRVDRYMLRRIEESVVDRQKHWHRDYTSADAYRKSVEPNRARLRRIIGVVDERVPPSELELVATHSGSKVASRSARGRSLAERETTSDGLIAESEHVRVYAVRWGVLDGVEAEGLLLEPKGEPIAQIVALPDADVSPEMLVGLADGVPVESQFARRLAEAGCRVLVPTLIDRDNTFSGNPRVRMTNQTHREFIYRQAYFMGRHIIGYEVQKLLAAVDYFSMREAANREAKNGKSNDADKRAAGPIGVAGHGEGGLIALYAAALDERIDAVLVSGYFQQREGVWQEPVYRNVWGLLEEFGDAEIASLIAPRGLVVEACIGPEVPRPPPSRDGRSEAASGRLTTAPLDSVQVEFARAQQQFGKLGLGKQISLVISDEGKGRYGTRSACQALLDRLGVKVELPNHNNDGAKRDAAWADSRSSFDPRSRMKRQFEQLVDHVQLLARQSPDARKQFWSRADSSSLERWRASCREYRDYVHREIIGWLPPASLPPNVRTRLIYDTPRWKGYEVVLDVWPEVIAYGILLVPRDLETGERRPVVVCQHGRGGRPQDVCNPDEDTRAYHSFGARLADQGFVVFAPQNLFIGEEEYRMLQRKCTPLKTTFFGPMVREHEQALHWLASLPFVDAKRIGFYGLSYGGKSAMLIPAVVEGYALSICSGDFNEEVWKHVSIDSPYSFMFTIEHDHSEFDFGDKVNYAELAGLIAPRPFFVERGHRDGVAPDEWVAYEYAKVRRLYAELGIGDQTGIEFFDGVHEIHLQGTLEFLRKHLDWPER